MESKLAAKATTRSAGSRSPTQRYRPISQSFSTNQFRPPSAPPISPDEEVAKLKTQNAELAEDVVALKMMVEKLRNDAERVRIRQATIESRRKSVSLLQSPMAASTSKSTPSPATVSALDLVGEEDTPCVPTTPFVA